MMAQQQKGRGGLDDSDSESDEDNQGLPPSLDVPPGLQGMVGMATGSSQPRGGGAMDEEGEGPALTEYTESQQAPDSYRYQEQVCASLY